VPINARAAYRDTAVTTASPGRILTMLYDRLARDLTVALDAESDGRHGDCHASLKHAQEIVDALAASLDLRIWPDGDKLARLYEYLQVSLVRANLTKDITLMRDCLAVVEPLGEAWHEAYRRSSLVGVKAAS
jgi:flagellar protein FliS